MKIILRILMTILGICGVLLLLYAIGFGRHRIDPKQVGKIELTAWNQDGTTTVTLNEKDLRKFITRFNLSKTVGEVAAERCECTFIICIYRNDGQRIFIMDHDEERMKVTGIAEQSVWISNSLLLTTIENLVQDYGLQWQSWDTDAD